jgi:2',3'-cyclic-nucleotide 2'-phosphodiesterase (5'-nucleotidase family)
MKRLTAFVVVGLGLVFGAGAPSAVAQQQVTLLHVNDTHSHLAAWGPKDANLHGTLGGLPKAAAIIADEKARDADALFVHAGDFMNGDLFFNEHLGVPELQLLRSIGLDAMVLGNRDFQLGSPLLESAVASAWADGGVPILGTNLDLSNSPAADYPALNQWITGTSIRDVNGVRVGFLGLTIPDGPLATPSPIKIAEYLDTLAPAAVASLRSEGAQVVVCLAHLGLALATQLAERVTGIDVIIDGHDHAALSQPVAVGTTLIVSAGEYYRWVGRLRLSVGGNTVSLVDYTLLGADPDTIPLPAMQEAVDALEPPIVARFGDVFHTPCGRAALDITNAWDPDKAKRDTPLGNLFTDAYRAWGGTDVALEATGFLDDPIPLGTIVGADLFRAMSFGMFKRATPPSTSYVRPYRLVTYTTSGADLLKSLEATIELGGDFLPQVSGMRVRYDSTRPTGYKIVSALVADNPVVPNASYTVTANEGVYYFLSTLPGITTQLTAPPTVYAFAAACSYITTRGAIAPVASNRMRDIAAVPGEVR